MKIEINKILLFVLLMIVTSSCFKDDSEEQKEQERVELNEYLTNLENQGVDVEKTESGLYYIVDNPSDSTPPLVGDYAEVMLTGRVLNGTVYETTNKDTAEKYDMVRTGFLYGPYRLRVGYGFTMGFHEGLLLMGEGAQYKIVIPSSLGYGSTSFYNVPAYSTLIYDMEMLHVIKDPVEHERQMLNNYLADIGIDPADSTDSGLYFQWIEESPSDTVNPLDVVGVKYKGMLLDGRVFDETETGSSYKFVAGNGVNIEGFDEGVLKMTLGSKARIVIPYYRGYGFNGYRTIPLFSTLVYEVEIVSIE